VARTIGRQTEVLVFSIYNTLQFIHVVAATLWLGGSVALALMNARLSGKLDRDGTAVLARQSGWVGSVIFGPAAIVTLVAGIGMLAVVDLGEPLWVAWGFIVVFASIILSTGFIRRLARRLVQLSSAAEPDLATVSATRARLGLLNGLNMLLLLSAVWAMVVKPV
jgi:putative copper export protein